MKKVVILVVLSYGLSFLLGHSFLEAHEDGRVHCSWPEDSDTVDWTANRAEDYARPTHICDLRRFVLDVPHLIDRRIDSTKRLATFMLERNRDLFEAALAVETDPEFEPYIARFIEEKGEPLLYDVRIVFSQRPMIGLTADSLRGVACDPVTRNIYVDPEYWASLQDKVREPLMFHELGHCDLNRDHTERFSLMNEGVLSAIEVNTHLESQEFYEYLYTKLFSAPLRQRQQTHHPRHRTKYINTVLDTSIILHRTGLGIDEAGLVRAGLKRR